MLEGFEEADDDDDDDDGEKFVSVCRSVVTSFKSKTRECVMFSSVFLHVLRYRVSELQLRVDQRQKLVVQARIQADDVIDDDVFYLNEPITEQMSIVSPRVISVNAI